MEIIMSISKVLLVAASLVTLTSVSALASSRGAFEECSFDAKYCDGGLKSNTAFAKKLHVTQSKTVNVWTTDEHAPAVNGVDVPRAGHDNPY